MSDLTLREGWLNAFMHASRPEFERVGAELPAEIRVSIGFPSTGIRSKRIGECWSRSSSADEHFEIFIHPNLIGDSLRVGDVLTHELVHAAVGLEAMHGPAFRKVAKALGLEGKMTATTGGEEYRRWAQPIVDELGPIPGAVLSHGASSSRKKTQTTRMLKLVCTECGFTCRATKKQIYTAPDGLICPIPTCGGDLLLDN